MTNYSIPPNDSIIGANPDGTGGIVVAPYPQYIDVPSDYLGDNKVIIGEDVIYCRLTTTPKYLINENLTIGKWIKLSVDGDSYNCLVEADHKVTIPVEYNDPDSLLLIDGNDTLQGELVVSPNRLELPFGYYPSTVLFNDLVTPLKTDQSSPTYIKNPLIIFGDDTLLASWPIKVEVNRLLMSRYQFRTFKRSIRQVLTRGYVGETINVKPSRLNITSHQEWLAITMVERLEMTLGVRNT